ncbi:ABC transporter substrate-binding protein [Pseudodesulfovibrio sp. zrk46]|uniref:substrate-binding periplasmic protein n=1 Tax=Pseudodesulfovibrio sp. zrk46 TaxID=2725288 RepID=UPI001449CF22|nr:ABC transporter substrate-binding protein [Pseudodesulfovibrio sp. zrk46]QJB55487.1 amino acid ABC transporter substrate-binding protein [Pseudodesulfovibrio sp. zrk46]
MRRVLLIVALLVLMCAGHARGEAIIAVTEEWPPYTFTEDGEIKGFVSEIVHEVLDRSGLEHKIEVYPFARSYETARQQPYVLLYPVFRLPVREDDFQWIKIEGLAVTMSLFRPEWRDIEIKSLEEAKLYRIGVTRETSTHHFLRSKGFKENVNLFPVNCEQQNTLKSAPETMRIDMTTGDPRSLACWLRHAKLPEDYWVEVFPLFKEDIYMAFGHATPPATVEKVRRALQALEAEGRLDEIIVKHCKIYR